MIKIFLATVHQPFLVFTLNETCMKNNFLKIFKSKWYVHISKFLPSSFPSNPLIKLKYSQLVNNHTKHLQNSITSEVNLHSGKKSQLEILLIVAAKSDILKKEELA